MSRKIKIVRQCFPLDKSQRTEHMPNDLKESNDLGYLVMERKLFEYRGGLGDSEFSFIKGTR